MEILMGWLFQQHKPPASEVLVVATLKYIWHSAELSIVPSRPGVYKLSNKRVSLLFFRLCPAEVINA